MALLAYRMEKKQDKNAKGRWFYTEVKINPLRTKLYLSDLKTQLVPRSKHYLHPF